MWCCVDLDESPLRYKPMLYFVCLHGRFSFAPVRIDAPSKEVERVAVDFKIIDLLHQILNLHDSWVTKFHHRITLFAYQVIVLTVGISTFVYILVLPELMPLHESTLNEKIQRIINSSTGNTGPGIFQPGKEFFCIQVSF